MLQRYLKDCVDWMSDNESNCNSSTQSPERVGKSLYGAGEQSNNAKQSTSVVIDFRGTIDSLNLYYPCDSCSEATVEEFRWERLTSQIQPPKQEFKQKLGAISEQKGEPNNNYVRSTTGDADYSKAEKMPGDAAGNQVRGTSGSRNLYKSSSKEQLLAQVGIKKARCNQDSTIPPPTPNSNPQSQFQKSNIESGQRKKNGTSRGNSTTANSHLPPRPSNPILTTNPQITQMDRERISNNQSSRDFEDKSKLLYSNKGYNNEIFGQKNHLRSKSQKMLGSSFLDKKSASKKLIVDQIKSQLQSSTLSSQHPQRISRSFTQTTRPSPYSQYQHTSKEDQNPLQKSAFNQRDYLTKCSTFIDRKQYPQVCEQECQEVLENCAVSKLIALFEAS